MGLLVVLNSSVIPALKKIKVSKSFYSGKIMISTRYTFLLILGAVCFATRCEASAKTGTAPQGRKSPTLDPANRFHQVAQAHNRKNRARKNATERDRYTSKAGYRYDVWECNNCTNPANGLPNKNWLRYDACYFCGQARP